MNKVITITVKLTDEQYKCLITQSAKNPDNSSIEGQLESAVSSELRYIINWSETSVDSNSINVHAETKAL